MQLPLGEARVSKAVQLYMPCGLLSHTFWFPSLGGKALQSIMHQMCVESGPTGWDTLTLWFLSVGWGFDDLYILNWMNCTFRFKPRTFITTRQQCYQLHHHACFTAVAQLVTGTPSPGCYPFALKMPHFLLDIWSTLTCR